MQIFVDVEMNRRTFITTGAISIVFVSAPCCNGHASVQFPHSPGCLLAAEDLHGLHDSDAKSLLTGNETTFDKSDDRYFDYALANTLAMIAKKFDVLPGFGYYDDSMSMNAYATPINRFDRGTGTVLMGMRMLKFLRSFPEYPEVAVAGVCAHEFGHILQYKHGLIDRVNAGQPTRKRCELQADFFAGYFAGLRKLEKPDFPAAVVAFAQQSFGDSDFGNVQHHGTNEERGAAVVKGFESALLDKPLGEIVELSTNYVMQL